MSDDKKSRRVSEVLLDMPDDLHMRLQREFGKKICALSLRVIRGAEASDHDDFETKMNAAIACRLKNTLESSASIKEKISVTREMMSKVATLYRKKELVRMLRPELSDEGRRILDYVIKSNSGRCFVP